jgi:hypothetical protein
MARVMRVSEGSAAWVIGVSKINTVSRAQVCLIDLPGTGISNGVAFNRRKTAGLV